MKVELEVLTDTLVHIMEVQRELEVFVHELRSRGILHDLSKFQEPEFSIFVKTRPEFKKVDYGTPEYAEVAAKAKVAVDHHYKNNRHHTAYFPEGIFGMNLVDIIEMICDWKAASRRSPNLSFEDSLPIAFEKYNISGQLKRIILNTIFDFFLPEHQNNAY